MWRCRRYIRFMRRVASTGQDMPAHEPSVPASEERADIDGPHLAWDAALLAVFARQGCDSAGCESRALVKMQPRRFRFARCRKTAARAGYRHEIADSGNE